jgi:hypothetical protein
LTVDIFKNAAHLTLRDEIGATGQIVGGKQRCVVDALNSQVVTIFTAQLIAKWLTDDRALFSQVKPTYNYPTLG